MTVPLSPTSPRRDAARRFGVELRKAMVKRQVGQHRVAEFAHVASSAVANWKAGGNLPTLATAIRLAETLDWPKLAEIARDARRSECQQCHRTFLNEGGQLKLFCSAECREEAARRRAGKLAGRRDAIALLQGEMLRVGPARKQSIGKALTLIEADRSVERVDRLAMHRDAVASMCSTCEPLGYCRTADCPLRSVSPLPLLITDKEGEPVSKAPGAWAPENRERMQEAIQAANAERWSRPGERERASAQTSRMWDENREELTQKVRAGVKRRDARRRSAA